MSFQRGYDEEIARTAALACINDGESGSYAFVLAVGTTLSVNAVSPGIYRVFLEGMDAAKIVAITVTPTAVAVELPSTTSPVPTSGQVAIFPGNVVERLRVFRGMQTVNARLVTGSGTLYLVQIVRL